MTASETADRVAAENWFLQRGLPSVLTPRARWRRLGQRSAPALAAFATFSIALVLISRIAGGAAINIDEDPTPEEWLIIVLLIIMIPTSVVAGFAVNRIATMRGRVVAAGVAAAVILIADLVNASAMDIVEDVVTALAAIALIVALNGLGIGSVLSWAVRLTLSHLTSLGALVARALPVVLLTVLVFFNGYVWSMATTISRERIWLVMAFMFTISAAFMVTGILERVRPMLASSAAHDTDNERLSDTPFSAMTDPITGDPLTRGERANVIFVAAASQISQVAAVAFVTASIFLSLGLMVLSPTLLDEWTKGGSDQGTWLGMTLPIPQALIHVTMFLGALTFMYVSARAVGDGEYRKDFLDPLVDDLRLTLVARNRYRSHVAHLRRLSED